MSHAPTSRAPAPSPRRRPSAPVLALLVVLALVLLACGGGATETAAGDENGADTATGGERGGDGDETDGDAAAGTVSIDHRYGSTEVPVGPERVVTVGLTDHDAFLALGVTPVGVVDWFGDQPSALWPWARPEAEGEDPTVVGDAQELDIEAVAALDPDVIVGLYSALTQDQYEALSQIAPTVAQPDEHPDWGVPWQELTRTVGRILGEQDRADEEIAAVEERFEQVRADNPALDGATTAVAAPHDGIYVYGPGVAGVRVLRSLGMTVPEPLTDMVGDADGDTLSPERIELLDVDVLVWLDAQRGEGPLAEPLYQQLDVHREGREVLISSASDLGGAVSFSSVLSLPYALDELEPRLAAAIDGDPDTEVPSAS